MKTFPPFHQRPNANRRGFSLVEIVIALSVVAFAFLSIVGLMGVGLASDQNSTQQTIATNIAASIVSDLQSSQNISGQSTTSPRFGIALATTPPSGTLTPLTNAQPVPLYFDNSGNNFDSTGTPYTATNGVFLANVYTTQVLQLTSAINSPHQNPVYIARIDVMWPAQATLPVGNVEVITQFQLHSN